MDLPVGEYIEGREAFIAEMTGTEMTPGAGVTSEAAPDASGQTASSLGADSGAPPPGFLMPQDIRKSALTRVTDANNHGIRYTEV